MTPIAQWGSAGRLAVVSPNNAPFMPRCSTLVAIVRYARLSTESLLGPMKLHLYAIWCVPRCTTPVDGGQHLWDSGVWFGAKAWCIERASCQRRPRVSTGHTVAWRVGPRVCQLHSTHGIGATPCTPQVERHLTVAVDCCQIPECTHMPCDRGCRLWPLLTNPMHSHSTTPK